MYLRARYYAPTLGRFISEDTAKDGYNWYVYCGNDPVNRVDPSGNFAIMSLIVGAAIGATISAAFETGKQLIANGLDWSNLDYKSIGLSVLSGAVSGAISAIPVVGTVIAALGKSFLYGGVASLASGMISGSVTDFSSAATAFIIGGAANMIAYGVSNSILSIKSKCIMDLSRKSKSLAVQQLQSSKYNMGQIALKGRYANAFKNISQKEVSDLIINASFMFRDGVYSSIVSSLCSGWM